MKAMILAAGRGERMRPLTDTLPKPLLPVGGKSLIEYHLQHLANAGVANIVINHAWLGEKILETLGDGSRYGVSLTYSAEETALETAGGIIQALPYLSDDDAPFIVVNGDIFCDFDFSKLVNYQMQDNELAHLVMVNNPEHHPEGDFSLVENGWVENEGEEKLTFSGIGLYQPALFDALPQGKRALAPLLREKMLHQQVSGERFNGNWYDIGTPERLEWLDQKLKS